MSGTPASCTAYSTSVESLTQLSPITPIALTQVDTPFTMPSPSTWDPYTHEFVSASTVYRARFWTKNCLVCAQEMVLPRGTDKTLCTLCTRAFEDEAPIQLYNIEFLDDKMSKAWRDFEDSDDDSEMDDGTVQVYWDNHKKCNCIRCEQ
jgi:hypothetical protein